MKRDRESLQRDANEADTDAALRRKLKKQKLAENRAERVAQNELRANAQIAAHLQQWGESQAVLATDYQMAEPQADPLGVLTFLAFPPLFSLLIPLYPRRPN